jgi:RNA polymerase sigma factor (sigma-70 family)
MQRYAQGEVAAFGQLYDRHEAPLWRFILRSLKNEAAAEDVMQETWITVTAQATRYAAQEQHSAQFRTWLFTLARSRIVDYARKHNDKSKPEISTQDFSDSQNDWLENLPANSGFGPQRQLESREQATALLQALSELPDEQREAFLMQAEAGMSVEEIAQACGVSFETAKSRLRYARAKLKQSLAAFDQEEALR